MTLSFKNIAGQSSDQYWYALYTRPRSEKKVDSELNKLGLNTFLPLKTITKLWSDRKKVIKEPLFPSYVFVCANLKERLMALQPGGVVRMVSFNGQPSRIPEDQINAVRRIIESGCMPVLHPYLAKGDKVQIVSGPLTGLQGFVVEHRGTSHIIMSIDCIRQSVSVRIDASSLKLISKCQWQNNFKSFCH